MSLYNMMHGYDPMAAPCLAALRLNPAHIGRFRDAYLDGDHIVILTRTGGGNREYFQKENAELAKHPLYESDADDEFDSTFALFRFRFPDDRRKPVLEQLSKMVGPPKSLRQKTDEAIKALQDDDPESVRRVEPLREQIKEIIAKLNEP